MPHSLAQTSLLANSALIFSPLAKVSAYFGGSRIHCSALCSAAVVLGGSFTKKATSLCDDGLFLCLTSRRQDSFFASAKNGPEWGSFTKKTISLRDIGLFYAPLSHRASSWLQGIKKPEAMLLVFFVAGRVELSNRFIQDFISVSDFKI